MLGQANTEAICLLYGRLFNSSTGSILNPLFRFMLSANIQQMICCGKPSQATLYIDFFDLPVAVVFQGFTCSGNTYSNRSSILIAESWEHSNNYA